MPPRWPCTTCSSPQTQRTAAPAEAIPRIDRFVCDLKETRFGDGLRRHGWIIRAVQWLIVGVYAVLVIVPALILGWHLARGRIAAIAAASAAVMVAP